MEWTSLNDLREKYLRFFESKGHLRLPSFPLVPINDKSLLLINSGMAPMKKYFTGEEEPPRRRVTTCQKCIRTPDLERVGHTARHGSFFEMLGNFSFGDYFKEEAIPWAWEFLTGTLQIPAERLWPSIYESDEEAYRIWTGKVGVDPSRVVRLGKADNFWEHGSGPCGPCSEIYFDRGEKYGCGSPDCRPGCDCDRYMEIWNNVFSQYNNDGKGNYTELAQKNIDTGMGLERLACVMQGVDNMFEVDSIRRILDAVCAVAGCTYGKDHAADVSIRVITDHIRGAMFMIADGVIPSNEGRGYVLRRILRRACRHGKLLGIQRPFLVEICNVAIGESVAAYPELGTRGDYIRRVIAMEEERFDATIDAGLGILDRVIAQTRASGRDTVSGADVFRLYDTYGFPLDLTGEIIAEAGLAVDEAGFRERMEAQRVRARAARGNIGGWDEAGKKMLTDLPKTQFVGYTESACEATVLSILVEDGEQTRPTETVSEGDCTVILDRTPFYGEGGGQVGDTGSLRGQGVLLQVQDTKKSEGVYLHLCHVSEGILRVGDKLRAEIDTERRAAIARNHSCCHLLQAALRAVLGEHVEQAGSYVEPGYFRFDFTHYAALTAEELRRVEEIVNRHILAAEPGSMTEMPLEEAQKLGALALFGEKYGKTVRVVRMGEFSLEFCGGTHVDCTGKIGLFRILSESSVAAGVRRIEGTTGYGVLSLLAEREALLTATAHELKANSYADLTQRASQLEQELRKTRRALESATAKLSEAQLSERIGQAKPIGKVRLLTGRLDMTPDAARSMCDRIRDSYPDMVAVFALVQDGRLNFVSCCGAEAVRAGAHAGNLLREVSAVCGGKGGGRADSAMSGGRDPGKIDAAFSRAEELLLQL